MPIFEYQCEACSTRFEELTLGSRSASPNCPDCSSDAVHKVYSTFAAQAKNGAPAGCEGGFTESASAGCGACGGPGPCSLN